MFSSDLVAVKKQMITLRCKEEDWCGPANCSRKEFVIRFTYVPLVSQFRLREIPYQIELSERGRETYMILASEIEALFKAFISLRATEPNVVLDQNVVRAIILECNRCGMRFNDGLYKLFKQIFTRTA